MGLLLDQSCHFQYHGCSIARLESFVIPYQSFGFNYKCISKVILHLRCSLQHILILKLRILSHEYVACGMLSSAPKPCGHGFTESALFGEGEEQQVIYENFYHLWLCFEHSERGNNILELIYSSCCVLLYDCIQVFSFFRASDDRQCRDGHMCIGVRVLHRQTRWTRATNTTI